MKNSGSRGDFENYQQYNSADLEKIEIRDILAKT